MSERAKTWVGLFNATTGPLVGAGLCSGFDVSAAAPAAVAGAVAAGVVVRRWVNRAPWSEAAFKAAVALSAGAWATWSTMTGPWHVANLAIGAGAAIVGAMVAPAFVGSGPSHPSVTGSVDPSSASEDVRALEWKDRIERICRIKPVTITSVDDWPNGAGFTLSLRFAPESGDTWKTIDAVGLRLAAAAYLPTGCVIGVAEGDRQGTAVVRVPTVNGLAAEVPMPDDTSPLSIWDEHRVGVNDDTSPALIRLRQEAGLIVSRRGGGKTNTLLRIICNLLRCRDNVTWIVDLNGGGLAVPIMMPYVDGLVQRPPIDWVAYSADEAILMAQVASAIARDRKARYGRLKAKANTDLLPVSPQLPQITIIIDESAEVYMKAPRAMDALLEVQRIGRAEGVNVIFSALRGTQDTIPVPVRKQATLKVCGVVESDSELEYVLPGTRFRSADLVYPGTMYMSRGSGGRQIKVDRVVPSQIAAVVCATEHNWPDVDEPAAVAGGRVYAERQQRLAPWLSVLRGDVPAGASDPVQVITPELSPAPSGVGDTKGPTERANDRASARANLRRFLVREQVKEMTEDDLTAAFEGVVSNARIEQPDPGWTPELLLRLVAENPGITPTGMKRLLSDRGVQVSDKTLFKWLDRYVADGKLRRADGGQYAAA